MSFFQKIIGAISGNVAEVDDNNQVLTVTNTDDQKTGKVRTMMENDGASFGHTAVSQATAETGSFVTGTANAPRKVPLGVLYLPIGAVVGRPSDNPIYRQFAAPIVIPPGKFFAIVAKVLRGTATATETLLFSVGFDAHYE